MEDMKQHSNNYSHGPNLKIDINTAMPYHTQMDIIRTKPYERKMLKLLSEEEIIAAENEIINNPEKWPVISGTGGIRKSRAAKGNSGKSGGIRVLYYFWNNKKSIYLLDVYAKNDKENLSSTEKKFLKNFMNELKGDQNA